MFGPSAPHPDRTVSRLDDSLLTPTLSHISQISILRFTYCTAVLISSSSWAGGSSSLHPAIVVLCILPSSHIYTRSTLEHARLWLSHYGWHGSSTSALPLTYSSHAGYVVSQKQSRRVQLSRAQDHSAWQSLCISELARRSIISVKNLKKPSKRINIRSDSPHVLYCTMSCTPHA